MSGVNTNEVGPKPPNAVIRGVLESLRDDAQDYRGQAAEHQSKAAKETARALELTQMADANEVAADLIERTAK
jgi:hypothetical protein